MGCAAFVWRLVGSIAAAMIFSSIAQAASVLRHDGKVSINKGNGYVAVVGSINGAPGDVVMAHSGGRCEIVYSETCREPVEPSDIKTIAEPLPVLSTMTVRHGVCCWHWGQAWALSSILTPKMAINPRAPKKPKSL